MALPDPGNVTRLLNAWSCGEKGAFEELVPFVYRELRKLAASHLRRERPDHTLQPTALVHEAYLRLIQQDHIDIASRAHFFAIASHLIREILVNHALRRKAAKRGHGNKVALDQAEMPAPEPEVDLLALNQALEKLAALDPRQCRIVEMRFFGGLTENEIAAVLGVSPITVKREWRTARAMLHSELRGAGLD
jgi:RNA polymerase sigma factor (TIGR02999 family)